MNHDPIDMLDDDSQQELLVKITPSEERDGGLEPLVTEPEWWGDMKEVEKNGQKSSNNLHQNVITNDVYP